MLLLAALSAFSGCQRALGPSDGERERLVVAYVRLSALLASAPGSAILAALADEERALAQPSGGAGELTLPAQVSAEGRAGDSWIDRAAQATEAATARQHALQQEALSKAIERRVARRREELEAELSRTVAEQQGAERHAAQESKAAAQELISPKLSDARLRLWLLERRREGPIPLAEAERAAAERARAEVEALEGELAERLAAIDARSAERLEAIETTQRSEMAKALAQYRDREWARARELGEAGAQRLDEVSRQARDRLAALAAVVEPASLSVQLPPRAPEPVATGGARAFGLTASALNRSQRNLAELLRWETAQRVRAAGREHGYSIRFQRPPDVDWPDVTEQARQWLRAETVR